MLTIREARQANPAFHWHPMIIDRRHLRVVHGRGYHYADDSERRALALGLLILRAQRREQEATNHAIDTALHPVGWYRVDTSCPA